MYFLVQVILQLRRLLGDVLARRVPVTLKEKADYIKSGNHIYLNTSRNNNQNFGNDCIQQPNMHNLCSIRDGWNALAPCGSSGSSHGFGPWPDICCSPSFPATRQDTWFARCRLPIWGNVPCRRCQDRDMRHFPYVSTRINHHLEPVVMHAGSTRELSQRPGVSGTSAN